MKRIFQSRYLPIIVAPWILFFPILISGKALFWGTPSTQFIPWWDFAWESILAGQIPLWNPWVGMGAPLAANYQSALFYPPYWVLLSVYGIGGVKLMAWTITIVVIFHLSLAGIGMIKLLDDLDIGKLGQVVSGLAFTLSGYLVSRAGFLSINATVAWLPWVLLYSKQLTDGRKNTVMKTGVVLGIMFLAGHAQTSWYIVLLGGLWIIFWSTFNPAVPSTLRYTLNVIGKFICAGLIGLGLSAIQILPTAEYLFQSARASQYGFAEAMTYSFWPWRFLTLIAPNLFGSPVTGNYWGYGNYWEDALYIGLLPIILAFGQLFRHNKGQSDHRSHYFSQTKALSIFLGLIVVIGFLFGLGDNTPVFPFLYRNVPTFDLFQAPTRFTIWSVFGLVVLAGLGIDSLQPPKGKRLYWNRLAVMGWAAISAAAGLAYFFLGDIETTFISSVALTGLLGVGVSLLLLFQPEKDHHQNRNIWQNTIIVFLMLDLVIAGYGLNPGLDLDFYGVKRVGENVARLYISESTEYELKYNQFFNFDTFESDLEWDSIYDYFVPNTAMLKKIRMVNNFDPITTARYQTWMDYLNELEQTKPETISYRQILDLMEVEGIVGLSEGLDPEIKILLPGPIQEIMFFNCARFVANDDDMLEQLFSGEVNLAEELILAGKSKQLAPGCAFNGKAQMQIVEKMPGRIIVRTQSEVAGWVYWSQSWYPGWQVIVDNERTGSALRANYYFQAAEISAGKHQVEFVYRPISFNLGSGISAVVLLLVGFFLFKSKRDREL